MEDAHSHDAAAATRSDDEAEPVSGKDAHARRTVAMLTVAALAVGCGGGGEGLHESLQGVDPSEGYWAIRATCTGGDLQVDFRPGERLSVPGVGYATSDEIAVECGAPERVSVSNSELRRRTATLQQGAELATPTYDRADLSCAGEGSLEVEAHPVWGESGIVGGGLQVRRGGHTIVGGAIVRGKVFGPSSVLQWWRPLCRPRR
jgi:hypothetical protein